MDRDALAAMLAAGRSIESIARETGKSASTVAYWVNKHGLTSGHAARHAARGGIEREQLAGAGRGRPLDPGDRRALRTSAPPRSGTGCRSTSSRRSPRATRGAASPSRIRSCANAPPRLGTVRPRRRPRPLSLRSLQHRGGERPPSSRQGNPRRRGRRMLRDLRVRRLRRCAAIPPPGPGDEGLRGQPPGGHAVARTATLGGAEVRATVRELPRDGRGRSLGLCPLWKTLAGSTTKDTVGGSSTAEHSAVNRRVVGSNPTPRAPARGRPATGGLSRLRPAASRRARETPRENPHR